MIRRVAVSLAVVTTAALTPAVHADAATYDYVGVVSFNALHKLTLAQARADARSITRRTGVDIVGWQESERFGAMYRKDLPGWATWVPSGAANEDAISWRTSVFSEVRNSRRIYLMNHGVAKHFPNRYVVSITLRNRRTGVNVAVLNTHVNSDIDANGHPKKNINTARAVQHLAKLHDLLVRRTSRVLLVTGDFNVDAHADARVHDARFPYRQLGSVATSNWMKYPNAAATNGRRRIDYVWLKRASTYAAFVRDVTIGGLHSDHNATYTMLKVHS